MREVERLLLVYDADSGLWGAFVDSARKVLKLQGCELCAITHGVAGERGRWRACRDELGVAVEQVHRDEVDDRLGAVVGSELPCIVAEAEGELVLLLTRDVIKRCRGSIEDLRGKLLYHAARHGLLLGRPAEPGAEEATQRAT